MDLRKSFSGIVFFMFLQTSLFAFNFDKFNEIAHAVTFWKYTFSPNYTDTESHKSTIKKSYSLPISVNEAKNALFYLNFAEKTYENHGAPSGWSRISQISKASGFNVSIFKRYNNIIVAFRGSELGTSDWITDGILAQNDVVPDQFKEAISFAYDVSKQYANYNIVYTGHSLGGGLATTASLLTGKPAFVFDAIGQSNILIKYIRDFQKANNLKRWKQNITKISNYNFKGEFVSDMDWQEDADTSGENSKQFGRIVYLDDKRFNPIFFLNNLLTRHFISPLREELEFLSNPLFRINRYDLNSQTNGIDDFRASFYIDSRDDTLEVIDFVIKYNLYSLPSLIRDIKESL
ncbi:MAG: DUF2974 domain-containing protein [Arcobacter sp.]|nr:DUF2974 domain-containing protein [Arcobacter sp.]